MDAHTSDPITNVTLIWWIQKKKPLHVKNYGTKKAALKPKVKLGRVAPEYLQFYNFSPLAKKGMHTKKVWYPHVRY